MKKMFLWGIAVLALMGCGGGGGGEIVQTTGVQITGEVYNQQPLAMKIGKYFAKVFTVGSVNAQIDEAISLPPVTINDWIRVKGTAKNLGADAITNVKIEISVEDPLFLTPEYWNCNKVYDGLTGNSRYGYEVWTVYGGILGSEQGAPTQACEGEIKDEAWTCDPSYLDCSHFSYEVSYNFPGDGLWKASGNIAVLNAGQEQSFEVGYKHDNMQAGNHTGTWAVKDSTGKILDQKKYTVVLEAAK